MNHFQTQASAAQDPERMVTNPATGRLSKFYTRISRGTTGFSLLTGLPVILVICFLLIRKVSEYDVWFHLTLGREILNSTTVPTSDHFTLLNLGRPFIDSQWLFQLLIASGYNLAGAYWLQAIQISLWGLTFLFVYLSTTKWVSSTVSFLLLLLVAIACENRFTVRPELVSVLMLALYYWRLQAGKYRTLSDIGLLIILQVIWANSHGIFVIGPFLAGCYLVDALLKGKRGEGYTEARKLGTLTAAMTLAGMITPYGLDSIRFALSLITAVNPAFSEVYRTIVELQSPFSPGNRETVGFWFYLLIMSGYLCSLVTVIAERRKELPIARTLVVIAMLATSLTGIRNMPLFALVALPLTAEYQVLIKSSLYRWICFGTIALLMTVAGLIWSPPNVIKQLAWAKHDFGAGFSGDSVPLGLSSFLDRIAFTGPVFNSQTLGGYYAFHGYPARIPFYDGRFEAYRPDDLLTVRKTVGQAATQPQNWRDFAAGFNFRGVLLAHDSAEAAGLLPLLPTEPDWRLVYLDNAASFWVRTDHQALPPGIDSIQASELVQKADYFQMSGLDKFFDQTGMFPEQRLMLLEQSARNSDDQNLLQTLGALQLKAGFISKAEQTFNRLLVLDPRSRTTLTSLAQTSLLRGDADSAEKYILQALKRYPDDQNLKENLSLIEYWRKNNLQR